MGFPPRIPLTPEKYHGPCENRVIALADRAVRQQGVNAFDVIDHLGETFLDLFYPGFWLAILLTRRKGCEYIMGKS